MKNYLIIVFICLQLGTLVLIPAEASPHPFAGPYLCLSPYKVDKGPLKIRDNGQCQEEDAWMDVQQRNDGVVLLMPSEPPLSKRKQKEWEDFKKFYEGEAFP